MARRSSSARAPTVSRSRWLRSGLAAALLSFAGGSTLAAQEPCASDATEGCDRRRWQREPEPRPQPSAADEPAARSAVDAEAKPWSSMLDREPPANTAPSRRRWYGWQTLVIDALGLSALLLQDETGVAIAGGVALLGAPIIHVAHQNLMAASVSFGIRASSGALITAAVLIAAEDVLGSSEDEETLAAIVAIVGLTGYAASLIIDASVLAYDEVPAEPARSYGIVPLFDPRRGSVGVRFALSL